MEAHASGKTDDLQHATGQLQRALGAEGLGGVTGNKALYAGWPRDRAISILIRVCPTDPVLVAIQSDDSWFHV
jgi:hypothetical protein